MTMIWLKSMSVFGPDFLDVALESRFLNANNKRKTTPHMQIAIKAADYALKEAKDIDESSIGLIFASSEGDMDVAEDNLKALIHKEKEISPQKFQNVILNAAAGHLGIFMKNTAASTSISGFKNIFAMGLVESYVTLLNDKRDVLLVVYDAPSQMPFMPPDWPFFSIGLVLTSKKGENCLAGLKINLVNNSNEETMGEHAPALACLPLIKSLESKNTDSIDFYYTKNLSLRVSLCF